MENGIDFDNNESNNQINSSVENSVNVQTNNSVTNQNKKSSNNKIVVIVLVIIILILLGVIGYLVINQKEDNKPSEGEKTTTTTVKQEIAKEELENALNSIPLEAYFQDTLKFEDSDFIKCVKKMEVDDSIDGIECEGEYYNRNISYGDIDYTIEGTKLIVTVNNAYMLGPVYDEKGYNVKGFEISYYKGTKELINENEIEEYVKNNNTKFPSYKHIFAKGNNEYVWRSTEVIK